jgi:hypothetical protein
MGRPVVDMVSKLCLLECSSCMIAVEGCVGRGLEMKQPRLGARYLLH